MQNICNYATCNSRVVNTGKQSNITIYEDDIRHTSENGRKKKIMRDNKQIFNFLRFHTNKIELS